MAPKAESIKEKVMDYLKKNNYNKHIKNKKQMTNWLQKRKWVKVIEEQIQMTNKAYRKRLFHSNPENTNRRYHFLSV